MCARMDVLVFSKVQQPFGLHGNVARISLSIVATPTEHVHASLLIWQTL